MDHIENGGSGSSGSSTGGSLKAGAAISIANNTIGVKFNSNTMELINGELSARIPTSGGESSGTIVQYNAGSGINISGNTIAVKYDPNTMEINASGNLVAKSSGSGGSGSCNVPTEDVIGERTGYQEGTFINSSLLRITAGSSGQSVKSGNRLRLKNRGGDIESFMLIRTNVAQSLDPHPTSITEYNAILYLESGATFPVCVYQYGMDYFILIPCEQGSYQEYSETDTDVGMFEITQMSYDTLTTIVSNMH